MTLRGKTAVIYGAGGAIGGAVARAFAEEGAHVVLLGRSLTSLEEVEKDILRSGGSAESREIDALDEVEVENHLDRLTSEGRTIDVSFNAVGFPEMQGVPIVDLSLEDFSFPIASWTRTVFLTGRAAGRRMTRQGSGVILTINPPPGEEGMSGGFGAASAAVLALSRTLASELGAFGVRVVCLQPNAVPESAALRRSAEQHAKAHDSDLDQFLSGMAGSTSEAATPA